MPHLQMTPSRGLQQPSSSQCNCNRQPQGQNNHSQLKNPQKINGRNQSPSVPLIPNQAKSTFKQEGTLEDGQCAKCVRSMTQQIGSQKSEKPVSSGSKSDKCGCTLEYFPCSCDRSASQVQGNKTNGTKGTKGTEKKQKEPPKCRCSLEYLWKTYGIHMDSFPCICPNIKNQKQSNKSQQGSGEKAKKSAPKCGCALDYLWNTYGMILESFPCICSNMKNQNKSKNKTTGPQESKSKQTKSQPNCRCTLEYLWHTYGMHMESFPCICPKIKKLKESEKSQNNCCTPGSGGKQEKSKPSCKCTLEYLWRTYGILMDNFPCICSSQSAQQQKPAKKPTESLTAIFNKRYFEWNCNPSKEQDCCNQNQNSQEISSGCEPKKSQAPLQCDCNKATTQGQTQKKNSECTCG